MRREGKSDRRVVQRSAASLLLIVYALAALFGFFHGHAELPTPSHVCAAHSTADLERDDGRPHDEDRCELCHLLAAPRLAHDASRPLLATREDPIGSAPRPVQAALVSFAPRVRRARDPPSIDRLFIA